MPPDPAPAAGSPPLAAAPRPFAAFLQEQRAGLLHSELSQKLAELVHAVTEHEKGGTITLTIKVRPSKVFGAVEVEDDVKAKPPEPDRDAALFFADDHGNLSRRDPRQPELPLREVGAPAQPNDRRS